MNKVRIVNKIAQMFSAKNHALHSLLPAVLLLTALSSSNVLEAQENLPQDAVIADIETLKNSPQRLWAKNIAFQDKLAARTGSKVVKIEDDRFRHFRTEALGDAYATEEAAKELIDMEIGDELSFYGTVFNKRGDYYVIVKKVLNSTSNTQGAIGTLGEILRDDDIQQHIAQQSLKSLLDVAQADMLIYANKNNVPFQELFDPYSQHSEAPLDIIRQAIAPLRNAEQMRPEELLTQIVHMTLKQHYTSGGNTTPNLEIPPELLEAAQTPVKPASDMIVKERALPSIPPIRTADAVVAAKPPMIDKEMEKPKNDKVNQDLDDLIAKLGSEKEKEPIVIGEPRKDNRIVGIVRPPDDPKSKNELMTELESVDKMANAPKIAMDKNAGNDIKNDDLLNDIESVLSQSPSSTPKPNAASTTGIDPSKPMATDDELDQLLASIDKTPMDDKKSLPQTNEGPATPEKMEAAAPANAVEPIATENLPVADRPMTSTPHKKKRGFFGKLFKGDDSSPAVAPPPLEEKENEIIEVASATKSPILEANAPMPVKTTKRDDYEFQFSPIPRYRK